MSKIKYGIFCCILFAMVTLPVAAQTVTVKMRVNTSTNADTLKSNHIMLMCGESVMGTTPALTWDTQTGVKATNVGGDYWDVEFQAKPGDQIKYKFVTYFNLQTPTFHWGGWEGPFTGNAGGNRLLVVGDRDTTLPIQYYHPGESNLPMFWRPFQSKQDTIAIYFRVNVGGVDFDPATGLVDVRGGLPLGAEPSWVTIKTLARETNSVNNGSFWSGVAYVPKSAITPGTTQQLFKFVIQPENWESVNNRSFTFSGLNDTTINWYYFNDKAPSGPKVNATILFRVKLDALEKAGLFNEALGDRLAVTGIKGWPPSGFVFDTEPSMLKLTYNSDLEEWNLNEPFSKYPTEVMEYKYYIAWDTTRVSPTSPNYIPGLALTNGWEEPGVTGGGNRKYIYTTETEQFLAGDFGYEQQFFNSIPPKGVIEAPIAVTFNVNMAPAADANINTTNPVFRPGVDSVFVQFDGSFVPVTQGLTMYGTDNRVELTDTDGDMVYSGTLNLNAPTFYQLCFLITYTNAPGASITNGGGVLIGRRYYQYIHPATIAGDGTVTWPATFSLPAINWVDADLAVEDPPDLDTPTGVEENSGMIKTYALFQNYPNPFNPSTIVKYSLPEDVRVKIEVYNVIGKRVATLVDEDQKAGTHSFSWNTQIGSNGLASGAYFLQMKVGSFNQVKKMMLLK